VRTKPSPEAKESGMKSLVSAREDLRAVGFREDGDAVGVDGVLHEGRRRPRRRREPRRGEEDEEGGRQSGQSHPRFDLGARGARRRGREAAGQELAACV